MDLLETNRLAPTTADLAALKPNSRFNFPEDMISAAVADSPEDDRREIKWASRHCRERNLSCEEFGSRLLKKNGDPYYADSVYQVFTGRRDPASIHNFAEAVRAYRTRMEETDPRRGSLFIETDLTRRIFKTLSSAFKRHKIAFIFGRSQVGKTTAVSKYAELHNHGETTLVRMPTGGRIGDFLAELAFRLGINHKQKRSDVTRRVMECFDDRTLLIVDECHQCLSCSDRNLASLEFCREIYDRRKCGLVLVGTEVFRSALRQHPVLKQLWLRGYKPFSIPDAIDPASLDDFAAAFGLDPADQQLREVKLRNPLPGEPARMEAIPLHIQEDTVRAYGLGRWLSILEDAQELAQDTNSKLSWSHVIRAHHQYQ